MKVGICVFSEVLLAADFYFHSIVGWKRKGEGEEEEEREKEGVEEEAAHPEQQKLLIMRGKRQHSLIESQLRLLLHLWTEGTWKTVASSLAKP
ncbi:hypothetical protein STEG23_021897, partial [Scotinomys teguina]